MKLIRYFLFLCLVGPFALLADTYPEVVFDNSLVSGSYARSYVQYQGKSWVENVNKHLLVSDTLFFTPGNSLSIKYTSAVDGDWSTHVRYSRQKVLYRVLNTDILTFRLYVKSPQTQKQHLPRFSINQKGTNTESVDISSYVSSFEYNKWLVVRIPCKVFKGLDGNSPINSVVFSQNTPSPDKHHIFIDQIEFLPKVYSEARLSSPAVLTDVVAYDKMVHLKWQLPLTPSIRYIKIYRSSDGQTYEAVGIKPIHMQSCLDDVPVIGHKYYYKVSWVDYNYFESPFSSAKDVETKKMDTSKLLDLIQMAHVNYFVENYDINSGMYMPYRSKEKAIVSVKETSGAILSMIIGAERNLISKQAVFNRISRIVNFLTKAQNYHGVYPPYFDGRKALPEYVYSKGYYDVVASTSILEALLVARQYFASDVDEEYELRNKITALYDRVDWTKLTVNDTTAILSDKIPLTKGSTPDMEITPIAGPNVAMNAYTMALGSSKHSLPTSAYFNSVYHTYDSLRFAKIEELDIDVHADSLSLDSIIQSRVTVLRHIDTLIQVSVIDSVFLYGQSLILGDIKGSLMDLYRPFLTIKPQIVSGDQFNWHEILKSYAYFVKRRDNETGVGVNNSDIWGFYQFRRQSDDYRINPAVAGSAIIVDREIGEGALLTLYRKFGENLFTEYGFRSWLNLRDDDVSDEYFAVNQSTLAIMIENARTGLIWSLYEQIPEFQLVRSKLFTNDITD